MSGPKPADPIQLTPEQSAHLEQLIRAHRTPQVTCLRAGIVLAAHQHPDWTNQQIAQRVGTADRIVRKWRRRWNETHSLADAPRPGAPRRFSP